MSHIFLPFKRARTTSERSLGRALTRPAAGSAFGLGGPLRGEITDAITSKQKI